MHPGGVRTAMAIFFFWKVSFEKHPNDHKEWQWTAFAILAMFFAKTGLSGSSIWWCWLVFDFLGIIFHLFWYPKWPKTSFANWATPPFWEEFPKMSFFLASQDALGVMLLTDWLMVSIDLTDVTLVSDDTERGLDWCDSGEHRCFPVTWLMLLWWVRIKQTFCHVMASLTHSLTGS